METKSAPILNYATIKHLAGESQRRCGNGYELQVYADGSILEATSENDVAARGNGSGGWESPILRINRPMSMKEIRDALTD